MISPEEMEARLLASRKLAEEGLLESALIVVWSALEAAVREASRAEGLQLPDQGPGPLITAFYVEGSLEREDYDTLMQILPVRNQAAHGFRVENIGFMSVDPLLLPCFPAQN